MKRSKPLLRTAMSPRATIKPKTCSWCHEEFFPVRPLQKVCGPVCGAHVGRQKTAAAAVKAQREERKATRAAKEAGKRLGTLRAEAQSAFNEFIRERDRAAGYGCICCGAPLEWESLTPGGKVDAGHYMSRGSCPELAFDERNASAQRKACNRPGGATRAEFRQGMVQRYGRAVVEELEGPHDLPQLRHDDYRQIRDTYRAKARQLKKERE